jgi:hypothetical protein
LAPSVLSSAVAVARQRGLLEPEFETEPGAEPRAEARQAASAPGKPAAQRVVPSARGFDFLSDLQSLFLPPRA